MSLPKIPGYSFNPNLGKKYYPRVQILDQIRDSKYTYYDDKIYKPIEDNCRDYTIQGEHLGEHGPKFLVYDKKVLCFDGYWMEGLTESADERYRIRNCKVYFYLQDDTIQVLEPRIRNSSLAQGTVVNRRRVMKQPPEDHCYYTVHDLNVGEVLYLGSRAIKLTNCDEFTSKFLRRLGKESRKPIEPPANPLDALKKDLEKKGDKKGKGYYLRRDNLEQFLNHNQHILKFYCFYNEEGIVNDPRSMILYYYLEDDTVEIAENLPRNCGRTFRLFLRRQKLPKRLKKGDSPYSVPSQLSDPGYLNVIRTSHFDHKTVDTVTAQAMSEVACYRDEDFTVGQYINVYGRLFLICDCDEFTKEYYRIKYGIDNMNSIDMNRYFDHGKRPDRFVPPHNGWGREEDSILNCINPLQPQEVVKDWSHYLKTKRTIDDMLQLTYLAKIAHPNPQEHCYNKFDADRLFIITYRIEDDNIFIKELTNERPGRDFFAFLLRGKIRKPEIEWKDPYVPEYYSEKDFYIGSKIHVKGHILELFLTDSYSLNFMEKNAQTFQYSSIRKILDKLHGHLHHKKDDFDFFLKSLNPTESEHLTYDKYKELFEVFFKHILNEQESITLARYYTDRNIEPDIEIEKMKAKIRDSLRKSSFMDYYAIKDQWFFTSPDSRHLDKVEAWRLLKGLRFPLSNELLCDLFELSESAEDPEKIDLCLLLDIIEWQKLHPDYYNRIGQYLKCEDQLSVKQKLLNAQNDLQKTFDIGLIKWKQLQHDIYNPPVLSKTHPATQRMLQSKHCIEAAF